MCDECRPKEHKVFWVHLADRWSKEDKEKMLTYLKSLLKDSCI